MTRASDVRKVTYQGDGSTVAFTIPFDFFSTNAYVNVVLIDETDPDEPVFTQQSYTTHFTISGTTLTMVTAPGSTKKLFIELVVPFTQLLDLLDGNFPANWQSTLETYLDKYVTMSQKLKDDLTRCVQWPLGSSESTPKILNVPEEDRLLKWDADGNIVNGPTHEQVEDAEGFATAAAASASSAATSASAAANSAAAAAASASSIGTSVTDAQQAAVDAQTAQAAAEAAQAAAETAEANAATSAAAAATSATNASTSATNASTSASSASTSATNASTSATAASAAQTAAETAQAAAEAAQAAAEAAAAGAGGGYTVENTRGSPYAVVAGNGVVISDNTKQRIKKYIQGSGGAVDISANPQVTAGTIDGQELLLVGRSDTNTVQLDDGTGLSLQGPCILGADQSIKLTWDGTNWVEESRSN